MNAFAIALAAAAGFVVLRALLARARRIPKDKLMQLIQSGAQVVDVRTPEEFAQAHADGSRNIPLDQLQSRAAELDRARPVVVCCASGARSSMARSLLVRAGFPDVHNAGPWQALQG